MPPDRQDHMHPSYQHFYAVAVTRVEFTGMLFPDSDSPPKQAAEPCETGFRNPPHGFDCWSNSYEIKWRMPRDVVIRIFY